MRPSFALNLWSVARLLACLPPMRLPALGLSLAGLLLIGQLPGVVGLLVLGPASAHGEPVRTVVTAAAGDGALEFSTDLARLWRVRYAPTPEHLAVRTMEPAEARLRAVSRGRADFAVVDVGVAMENLADFPRLTALAVLWPSVLHVATRNAQVRQLGLPLQAEIWLLQGAAPAQRVLTDATRKKPGQRALLQRMPDDRLLDALHNAREPLLLFLGPAPAREVSEALRADRTLRLLPVSDKLLEEFKLAFPWMTTAKLAPGLYEGEGQALELPAVYQVLVGRRDLPMDTARKVLDTVYGRSSALALFNPLFGQVESRMNAVFGKLLPFHRATARRFNFAPAVP